MKTTVLERLAPSIKTVLNNQRAKVYEVELKAGQESNLHLHREDYIVYAFKDAKLRMIDRDGRTDDIDIKAGDAYFRRGETHTVRNVGNEDTYLLVFQFNEWGP